VRIFRSARRCVKGLATFPRMLTPVAGFCRLLEPLPQSVPTSDVLVSSWGTAESAPAARSAPCTTPLDAMRDSPQNLEPPFPPTCLECDGRETQNA